MQSGNVLFIISCFIVASVHYMTVHIHVHNINILVFYELSRCTYIQIYNFYANFYGKRNKNYVSILYQQWFKMFKTLKNYTVK